MDHTIETGRDDSLLHTYKELVTAGGVWREIWAWAMLAISSLAVAGLFALFVALSRVPGVQDILPWPPDFFHKGLVIHVVFSFVVWFLAVFALLAALACLRLAANGTVRFLWAGWAGVVVTTLSFPLLFIPAFLTGTDAILSNYIPVIEHPLYEFGLVVLFVGVSLPVIRLFANFSFGASRPLDPLSFAVLFAGGIFFVAILNILIVLAQSGPGEGVSYEKLFWGGGHVLQFLNTALMLCGWYLLSRFTLHQQIFDTDLFRLAAVLLMVFVMPALLFYAKFEAFSDRQTEAFTSLQYALALPVLLMAGSGVAGLSRNYRGSNRLPWSNAGFLCLILSIAVFGIGGLLGFMVDGADTRTPAHYHGVIAGVTLAFMGLFISFFLPILNCKPASARSVRILCVLFGAGQMLACVGLFLAGGHGAPRKAPGEEFELLDGAVIGLFLNGIGALIAVIGGAMFIWIVLVALLRGPQTEQ